MKGVFKGRQLGSPERIREKINVKTATLVSSELAGERENVLRIAESKITELEEKAGSAEKRARAAAARAVRAEIRCDRIPDLEQQLQSTQQHLHTKEEELKARTTQHRTTQEELLHTQEQLSTQQQALSHWQYTAQQNKEQLQARVLEITALQSKIVKLEQMSKTTQAALGQIPYLEQQLKSKEAQLQSLTQIPVQPVTASVCQAGLQAGAVGTLHPAELQSRNEELQQRVTYLEEELAKESFLETALGYEVDAFREDLMERQQVEFHNTSTQTVVDDICIPGTKLTGEQQYFVLDTTACNVLSLHVGPLRGAEVVAERDFVLTNRAQSYDWDEYGFRLHVPKESLDAGLSETTVNVRVSLSGQFQLLDDSEFVSAVYWVFSPHTFFQPLTVDVQHCAAPSQCCDLSFVRTKCIQKELPYQFKELEGGVFSQQSLYGSISVNHFSGVAVKRRRKRGRSEEVSEDYCAQLYKSREGLHDHRFTFAITRNLEACFSVSCVIVDQVMILL